MNELDPDARALIDLARGAEDGTMADRARIKRRIGAALGATTIAATAREALDSGIQTSGPLGDAATGGLVERVSGEVLRVAPSVSSGAALGGVSSMFVQAAALLLGGALAGGAAWFALSGGNSEPAPSVSAVTAPPAVVVRNGEKNPSARVIVRGEESPRRDPAQTTELVPQPEPVNADAPMQLEDLPVLEALPSAKGAIKRAPSRRSAAGANARPPSSLADEARDLAAVQEALRQGNHGLALSRLDAMDRRSRGALGEERSVARVLSLCGLGRVSEAEGIARRVESVAPESPLLPRLRSSCAKGALAKNTR